MRRKKFNKDKKKHTTIFIILVCVLAGFVTGTIMFTNNNNNDNNNQTSTTQNEVSNMTIISIQTNKGTIEVELNESAAPVTVQNFLSYVDEGFYANTIFHRVIDDFMIQGGGFLANATQKETKDPITLESDNGLHNKRGTIAMARTNDPNSATAQFFINTADNNFLDYTPSNPGYAVFGKVVSGMDVVDSISNVQTKNTPMPDWPSETIIIESITRK